MTFGVRTKSIFLNKIVYMKFEIQDSQNRSMTTFYAEMISVI